MKKLGIVLAFLAVPVFAGQFEDMTAAGHDFGASQQGYLQGIGSGVDARAGQYGGDGTVSAATSPCSQPDANGNKVCGGQVMDPSQSPEQYYGNDQTALEDEARLRATTDENAQWMFQAHTDRPVYDVKQDDPLLKHDQANQSNMVSLSETYSGCKDIAYGGTVSTTQDATCKKIGTPVFNDTTCHRSLALSCANSDANQKVPITVSDFTVTGTAFNKSVSADTITFSASRSQNCSPGWISDITFNVEDVRYVAEALLDYMSWDDSISVALNGTVVFTAFGGNIGLDPFYSSRGCELSAWRSNDANKDLKPFLRNGTNTIRVVNRVGGGGGANIYLKLIRYKKCTIKETYAETCDASFDRAKAALVSSSCTAGPLNVNLGYETGSRSCYRWDDVYRWEDLPSYSEEPLCQTLRDQGCAPTGSTCLVNNPSGWCQEYQQGFQCTSESPENVMQVCGDTLVCPGGSCYDAYKQPADATQDFLKAASYLAAMEDMRQEFDPNAVTVWKGEFQTCSVNDTLIGSDQCCTGGSGTINDLGKTCNATEQKIIDARNAKKVTFLRSWTQCTQQVLGACVNKVTHYEFCLWPSKLARIVQDQGRPMLGQTVANPCPGFLLQNPNEFEGIDWSRIDFSEFYTDVMASYNATPKPSPAGAISQVQASQDALLNEYTQKMQQYGK